MKKWIPIFPLKLVLFPGETIPLHIFENRYREMISYCRSNNEFFGIVAKFSSRLPRIACQAEIAEITQEYPDGKLDILCKGKNRCYIYQFDESKSYLRGEVEEFDDFVDDLNDPLIDLKKEVTELYEELMNVAQSQLNIPEPQKPLVAYDYAHQVGLSLEQKQQLLEKRSERERLELIRNHMQEVMPRIKAYETMKEKVKSNGHFRNFPDT